MASLYQFFLLLNIWSASGIIMPITKSDGSLDISSLLSHLSLLEHSIDTKASAGEVTQMKTDLAVSQSEITTLNTKLDSAITELRSAQSDLVRAEVEIAVLKNQLTGRTSDGDNKTGGATFTRWGRTSCPVGSTVVYKGSTGGTLFSNKAAAATILCLPEHPIYANYTDSGHTDKRFRSTIYGTEYLAVYPHVYFENMRHEDMPCVVCESSTGSESLMVPARNTCYPGWSLEYSGYLMGPADGHASGEYICVDSDPEALPGGHAADDGQGLCSVEGKCGSLHCPPYHDNWELTCAVCSKKGK